MEHDKLIDIYEHLFAEAGWKEVVEDLVDKKDSIKESLIDGTLSFEKTQFLRGLAAGYEYIIGLESTIEEVKRSNDADIE